MGFESFRFGLSSESRLHMGPTQAGGMPVKSWLESNGEQQRPTSKWLREWVGGAQAGVAQMLIRVCL